jgi:hypothetical protein
MNASLVTQRLVGQRQIALKLNGEETRVEGRPRAERREDTYSGDASHAQSEGG